MLTTEQLVRHYASALFAAQPGSVLAEVEQFIGGLVKQVGPIIANAILAYIAAQLGLNLPPLNVPVVSQATAADLGVAVPPSILAGVKVLLAIVEAYLASLTKQGHS